jgi:hypothetical protein
VPLLLLIWIAAVFGLVLAAYVAELRSGVRVTAFWLLAGSPMIAWTWFNAPSVLRDVPRAVTEPYFGALLFLAVAFSTLTLVAAWLGRRCGLGRFP